LIRGDESERMDFQDDLKRMGRRGRKGPGGWITKIFGSSGMRLL